MGRRRWGWLTVGVLSGAGCLTGAFHYWRADQIQRRRMRVTANGIIRFIRSVSVGMTISLDYWWTLRGLEEDSPEYDAAIQPCHQRSADRIVAGALKNGGLYIKLGQGLGTFNQVLPRQYINTLKNLQDMAFAREYSELEILFQEDFGCHPSELFLSFNPEAIAAASLAQVFKAVTHDNQEVAVKAQYIDLRDRYDGDIWTIKLLLRMVAFMHPKFKLAWIFEELRETLAEELDFEHEAHNLERCAHDMMVFPHVYVPKVHWKLTSKRVLTAEWIDGCKATDKASIKKMGLSTADVAQKVISAFGYQLFHTGFVHGDPHPGNVFIRHSPSGGAEIVLLDHGLYMSLPESLRLSLCKIWKSIIKHDIPTLKNECESLGVREYYDLLAIVLTGRSLETHKKLFGTSSSALTKEDVKTVLSSFQRLDEVMDMLRILPTPIIIAVRNLNIVRSINRELGTPVNRFNIMSKIAISGSRLTTDPHTNSWRLWITTKLEGLDFDLRLMWISFKLWCSVQYLKMLTMFGYLPSEMSILQQAMQS